MLRLHLFGSPLIESTDPPLQFRSRKIEALLYYLSVTFGHQHRRPNLASLLWSELPEEKALGNLRYALWNLRQVLNNLPLTTDRLTITLQPDKTIWVDVNEFQHLLNADDKLTDSEISERMARLQRAVDLYRGGFLDGFEITEAPFFDEWLQIQRTTLHDLAVDALTRLGAYYTTHHQLPEAIAATRHLLELEPWQEAAHRQIMTLLMLSGHRNAALTQYQQCRQILEADLDLEPEPETQALYQRIHTGQFEIETKEQAIVVVPETNALATSLFGRQTEYAWLANHWEAATQNQSNLILLRGEAGVGKTRLIEEFGRHILLQGGILLQGRCYEFGGPLPYQPIATALQSQVSLLTSQTILLSDTWLAELAHLLPDVRSQSAEPPPIFASGPGTDRYRLFEAVTQFLQALSTKQPILFFLDDLHWADVDTLDLLGYLARRLTTSRLLIIGTYRPGEVLNDHALEALRKRSQKSQRPDRELTLTSFPMETVQQIAHSILPVSTDEQFALFLFEISQGNPFILFETLNEMQEREWLQATPNKPDETWSLQLPDSSCLVGTNLGHPNLHTLCNNNSPCQSKTVVVAVGQQGDSPEALVISENLMFEEIKNRIRRRIARLSTESQHLLSLAAVVGRSFETKLLQTASQVPLTTVLDSLDDWLARNLIKEVSYQETTPGNFLPALGHCRYDFSHDLIRSVIYNDLSQARRQALHLQIGSALEQLYANQSEKVTEWLAHHFHCGYEPSKALTYLQKAGQQAQMVYALPVALERYQQALFYWEKLYNVVNSAIPTDAWRQRWDLLLNQTEVSRMLGRLEQQNPSLDTVVQEVTDWGDDRDRLKVIEQQLARLEQSSDLDQRRQLAKEGLQLAQLLNDSLATGNFLQAAAECERDMANHDEALAHYEAAKHKFSEVHQTRQVAFCLIGMGKIHVLNNRFAQALSHFEQAGTYAKSEGHQDALIWSFNAIARMYLFLGNLTGAQAVSQKALTLCDQTGFDSGASAGLIIQGYVNMLNGNLAQAQKQFDRAWLINRDMGQSLRMAEVECCLGHLSLRHNDGHRAHSYFQQAEMMCGSFYHGRAIEARSYRAIAYLMLGQLKEALNCSHHAVVWLIGREHVMYAPQRVYWNQYKVLLAQMQPEEAQEALVKGHRVVINQLDNLHEVYPSTIDNDLIKDKFLTKLPWNQDIMTMWDMLPLSNSHVALHLLHGDLG